MSNLKEAVTEIRKKKIVGVDNKNNPIEENNIEFIDRVAREIHELLVLKGFLFKNNGNYYYFYREDLRTYSVGSDSISDEFNFFMSIHANISKNDNQVAPIFTRLFAHIRFNAKDNPIYSFSHYNIQTNILYLRKNEDEIIKITSKDVSIVDNGTDNVIMYSNYDEINIDVGNLIRDEDMIEREILDKMWFKNEGDVSAVDSKQLLTYWIYSLFFVEIVTKRPILVVSGAAGSGKTTLIDVFGKLIFGDNFFVQGITKDERDFLVAATQSHLLAFDNIDEDMPEWFADKLAGITTGMGFRLRKLYQDISTGAEVVKPRCFVAITSRSPKFNRDDIADRSVVILLDRKDNLYTENLFNITRDSFWQSFVLTLQDILKLLETSKDVEIPKSEARLIEFVAFSLRLTKEKSRDDILELFSRLRQSQSDFASDDKPLVDAIVAIGEDKPGKYLNKELLDMLKDEFDMDLDTTYKMGRLLSKYQDLIKRKINFERDKASGKIYYFIGDMDGVVISDGNEDNSEAVEMLF